ncbi:MAG: hypothetical protein PHI68_08145 [Candidatus Cloacimonetes bacterium]|nr:hypothetical protein [Candidatus Cloacimonadota bacterium]
MKLYQKILQKRLVLLAGVALVLIAVGIFYLPGLVKHWKMASQTSTLELETAEFTPVLVLSPEELPAYQTLADSLEAFYQKKSLILPKAEFPSLITSPTDNSLLFIIPRATLANPAIETKLDFLHHIVIENEQVLPSLMTLLRNARFRLLPGQFIKYRIYSI